MQIDPAKYKSISSGFGVLLREQGIKGLSKGWVPTLLGFSAQGACKFGFYEFFKKYYSDLAGPEYASKYKTLIYLAGSASAEVIADAALCPMEAVKVRVQTQPGFARGLSDGLSKFLNAEGFGGLFKGIVPLGKTYSLYNDEMCSKPLQLGAVKKMGLWGLFTRGLPLRIVMIGTLTGAQWGIYDAFKVFVGLKPTTGGGGPIPASAKK
ncbi:Mitochondrial phosphate carrier protein 3 [Hibiscus syriacus]|uniref:Mitochondrial phosphate carrier protein 3 n=1 Tax=Hibiscus syriacus TaxID=106335 RepID=A0A6A2WW16_HIBSY|nr:Mitochondrial phosphate carrier protein 3 [Hibiscus syriacus]